MKPHWIDVHTHLHMLKGNLDEVIQTAQEAGVEHMITIGTHAEDWPLVLKHIQQKWKGVSIYGALGCHPHEAQHYSDLKEADLKEKLQTNGIVALGEIGLDYYYEHSDRKVQQEVFRRQMDIASQMGLNVEIHTRDAEDDTIEILTEYKSKVRGLLHCFTGSWNMAQKALDIGYNISFSGILTFKKAQNLQEVCAKTPLTRLHVETDAPYLAPTPHRGRENQPAYLIKTAMMVSDIHKVPLEKVKSQTWENANNLFPLKTLYKNGS